MGTESRWLRLNVDWDETPWVDELSNSAQLAWIKLLCHVKRDGLNGRARAQAIGIASRKWGIAKEFIEEMIAAAIANEALSDNEGRWIVRAWATYQNPETARRATWREVSRDSHGTVTGESTTPIRVTETETRDIDAKASSTKRARPKKENPAFDPAFRVVAATYKALGWPEAKAEDIKPHLKATSPVHLLISEFGEEGTSKLFLFAHKNWATPPTWKSVFSNRGQLSEQMKGRTNGAVKAKELSREELEAISR